MTLLFLCLGGGGALLMWVGWARRVDRDQHFCRKCGYIIVNTGSARCPECGTILTDRYLVTGRRKPEPWSIGGGFLIIMLATGIMGGWFLEEFGRIDWDRHAPTWVLLRRDVSGGSRFGSEPVMELRRRHAAGELSESQCAAFSRLLARRATNTFMVPQGPAPVIFTGSTLKLLHEHDPGDELAEKMLHAMMNGVYERTPIVSLPHESPRGTTIIELSVPVFSYLPDRYTFDRSAAYPAMVGLIGDMQLFQSGNDLEGRWLGSPRTTVIPAFECAGPFDPKEPLIAEVEISWYMVNEHIAPSSTTYRVFMAREPVEPREPEGASSAPLLGDSRLAELMVPPPQRPDGGGDPPVFSRRPIGPTVERANLLLVPARRDDESLPPVWKVTRHRVPVEPFVPIARPANQTGEPAFEN